jgi:hypothetical protein
MGRSVSLPTPLYERLAQRSRQLRRTPERVVVDLIQRYLTESDDCWHGEFRALLARVQGRTTVFSSGEIEADITLAAAEARELRRAQRPA